MLRTDHRAAELGPEAAQVLREAVQDHVRAEASAGAARMGVANVLSMKIRRLCGPGRGRRLTLVHELAQGPMSISSSVGLTG